MGEAQLDTEDIHKTSASTFKPKSLRNRAQEKMERLRREADEKSRRDAARRKSYLDPVCPFSVSLKPTGINENASHSKNTSSSVTGQGRARLASLKKAKVKKTAH